MINSGVRTENVSLSSSSAQDALNAWMGRMSWHVVGLLLFSELKLL